MKVLGAIAIVLILGAIAFASAVFGAMLLSSANGPTRGNWFAAYAFMLGVPIAIVVVGVFLLVRLFR